MHNNYEGDTVGINFLLSFHFVLSRASFISNLFAKHTSTREIRIMYYYYYYSRRDKSMPRQRRRQLSKFNQTWAVELAHKLIY